MKNLSHPKHQTTNPPKNPSLPNKKKQRKFIRTQHSSVPTPVAWDTSSTQMCKAGGFVAKVPQPHLAERIGAAMTAMVWHHVDGVWLIIPWNTRYKGSMYKIQSSYKQEEFSRNGEWLTLWHGMTQPKIRTLRLVNFSQQLVSSTVKHKVTVEFTWIVPRIFNHHPKWQVPRPTWIRMGTWYTYRCSQNVYVLYVLCMHIHVSPWCGLCKHVWTNNPLNLSFPRWRDFLLCFSGSLGFGS